MCCGVIVVVEEVFGGDPPNGVGMPAVGCGFSATGASARRVVPPSPPPNPHLVLLPGVSRRSWVSTTLRFSTCWAAPAVARWTSGRSCGAAACRSSQCQRRRQQHVKLQQVRWLLTKPRGLLTQRCRRCSCWPTAAAGWRCALPRSRWRAATTTSSSAGLSRGTHPRPPPPRRRSPPGTCGPWACCNR